MLEVLPTEWNTLLLEAGCAAMKTRMLLNWLVGELKSNPDMPILFVTCRKIHADDTLATLKGYEGFDWETHGFKNYLDARSAGQSKTAYMKDEKRLVVSLQSLNRIDDLTHFKGGLVVIDEVRSAASIPGGVTLPHEMSTLNTSLYTLCAQAKYRVFMDADVSADGAVESLLRIIVPQFDLVHVQLTQAALSRTMSIAFSGGSSIGKQVHQDWLRLKLLTARASRQPMVDAAARLIQAWGRRYLKRDGAAANRSLKRALHIRISKMREGRAACPPVGRVLVVCGTPGLAQEAAELCDMLGITYRLYTGRTSDKGKRSDFQDTTKYWRPVECVITTTTMTVAVNVILHFSCVFLFVRKAEEAGKLREELQAVVRVGRDANDPLDDERIFTLLPGEPPDMTKHRRSPQEKRFYGLLRDKKLENDEVMHCEETAASTYDAAYGAVGAPILDESTPRLKNANLELHSWNELESKDNRGDDAIFKLVELCALPTRNWPVELLQAMDANEEQELDQLNASLRQQLEDEGAAYTATKQALSDRLATYSARLEGDDNMADDERARLESLVEKLRHELKKMPDDVKAARSEDWRVSKMTPKEQYEWLLAKMAEERDDDAEAMAETNGIEPDDAAKASILRYIHERFFVEQDALCKSTTARPEKDSREIAKEKIYGVLQYLQEFPSASDYSKMSMLGPVLHRRAVLTYMPIAQQKLVSEFHRRKGRSAHPMVQHPIHVDHAQLQRLADVLKLAPLAADGSVVPLAANQSGCIDRLVHPTTFTEADAWVQVNNRLRRGRAAKDDEAMKSGALSIAKVLRVGGAYQGMTLYKLMEKVLEKACAMAPSKKSPGLSNPKEPCNANTNDGRAEQLQSWRVDEELPTIVPKLRLELLRPDGVIEEVPANEWQARFGQLQAEHDERQRQVAGGEDADEEFDNYLRANPPAAPTLCGWLSTAPRYDPFAKVEKYDLVNLQLCLKDMRSDEPQRCDAKQRCFQHLAALRPDNPLGEFKAAGIAIVLPGDTPHVLLALEERGGQTKLNFIGGKREHGETTPRQTAAREAQEETKVGGVGGGLIDDALRARLEGDAEVMPFSCWIESSKYTLFAYELNDQSIGARVAALGPNPVPSIKHLRALRAVPIASLLNRAWCSRGMHAFCKDQLEALRPWLQAKADGTPLPVADAPMPNAPDDDAMSEDDALDATAEQAERAAAAAKLERWHDALRKGERRHEYAVKLERQVQQLPSEADDRRSKKVEYEHKGIGGRKYAIGEALLVQEASWARKKKVRSAVLQGMPSEMRSVIVGASGYDMDCENGDFRLYVRIATRLGIEGDIAMVLDYIENRDGHLQKIRETHGTDVVDKGMAKRLPNIISNGGSYRTWLNKNGLPFNGYDRCYRPMLELQRQLKTFRDKLLVHPQYKPMVDAERERLRREGEKTENGIEASLMSRIVQTEEDQVLGIIDRTLFDLKWRVLALVFDGLIAEPGEGCRTSDQDALKAAEAACGNPDKPDGSKSDPFGIKLAVKPLHGKHQFDENGGTDDPLPSMEAAREALREFEAWEEANPR